MFRDLRRLISTRPMMLPALAATAVLLAACGPANSGAAPAVSASPAASAPTTATAPTTDSAPTTAASSSPSPTAGGPTTAAANTAACTTKGLSIDIVEASGGAAAGSNYLLVRFKNTGTTACTLYGWPGVSLVGDGNGTQLGAAAQRVQSGERRTVTVQPGKRTTALLQVSNAGNYPKKTCGPVTADGFRIYVPNQKAAVYVARKTPACSKSGVTLLHIAPVGTSG